MNSKTITFWGILIAGVIAVSAASWFIGNAVAGHVIQNRKNQKESAAAQSSEKAGKNGGMDQNAESLSITDMDQSDPVEAIDDSEPSATDTSDALPDETDSPAAPETIPSADAVSGGQPAGHTADDSADELFGDNSAAPADDNKKQPPEAVVTTPETPAPAAKILYRVQIGAFSSKDSADKLMRELELQGYKVHMSEVKLSE